MLPADGPGPAGQGHRREVQRQPVSSGPYKFESYEPGKSVDAGPQRPNWDPTTDPIRKALPDQIDVKLSINADDIDNRLLAGDLDVDIAGTGVSRPPRRRSCTTRSSRRTRTTR